ncbi:MAG TPA: DUF4864 domain-containing protein [Propylenella sp.]
MRILLVLLVMAGLSGAASAFSDTDRAAIQSTIEQQLQAFLGDDAARAYSFAAPNIRARFPTKDIFMEMVRKGYPQVYRPRTYAFGELKEEAGYLAQDVDIVDADGGYWTARYTLERQPDGSWKITGCYLLKKPGQVA